MRHPLHGLVGLLLVLGLLGWLERDSRPLGADDSVVPPRSTDRTQVTPASTTRLNVPDGFLATLFADDSLVHNAYCLAEFPAGQIAVSGPGYIRILADPDQDGRADLVSTFANGPQSGAQGLCFDGSDLLAVGDGGLLRYRDADGDFRADAPPTRLLPLKTGGEHHAHAIRRGPDDAWYLMCGNMTFDDPPNVTALHSPVTDPRAGVLLRFEYSSDDDSVRNVAIIADGMRNAYDFDFLRSGDVVTFDSDDEREISLPWYRPTRVFRLLPGSDAGWVSRSWKFPRNFPEMPETIADLGRGSPTGVLVLRDARWPEPFDNAIFVCDWTFGRVVAIPLDDRDQPGESIELITASGNAGFAPTDIVQTADGSLIISSGGRGTTGHLFRLAPLSFTDENANPTPAKIAGTLRQELIAQSDMSRLREALTSDEPLIRRTALEVLAGTKAGRIHSEDNFAATSESILLGLADTEPNIRKAAMHVVGTLSATEQERLAQLITVKQQNLRICFELGRNRGNQELDLKLLEMAVAALESPALAKTDEFDAVRLAQVALGDAGGTGESSGSFAGYTARGDLAGHARTLSNYSRRCAALFPTGHDRVDRELVRLLAMLAPDDPRIRGELLAQITPDSHPTGDLHHLFAMSRLEAPWTSGQGGAVAVALLAIDEKLANRNLNRDLYWKTRLGDLVNALADSNPELYQQIVAPPNFGRPGQVPLLAAAPAEVRARAATEFLSHDTADFIEEWTPEVVTLVAEFSTNDARHALRAAYKQRRLRDAALRGLARHPDPSDRPKFITGLDAVTLETVTASLAALKALEMEADSAEIAALARAVGRFDRNRQEYALRGRIVARLQFLTEKTFGFELGEAGYRPQRDAIAHWTEYARTIEPESTAAGDAWASLIPRLRAASELPGNDARGAMLYRDLACDRCHGGGVVGPDLAGVMGRFSREDLFRAIVEPDRDIPSRYRGILVQTKQGKIVTGLVAYESTDGVTLKDGQETWRIEAKEIELRQPLDTSLMPRGLLREATPQELADLEAYVRTL